MSVVTANDIWEEYKRLRGILTGLEDKLLAKTSAYAAAIRKYRTQKAQEWVNFAEANSATARRDATDNAVSKLKGEADACEAERDAIRELIWNTRAQLSLLDDVAGVVRSEIRMAGRPS